MTLTNAASVFVALFEIIASVAEALLIRNFDWRRCEWHKEFQCRCWWRRKGKSNDLCVEAVCHFVIICSYGTALSWGR